MYTTSDHHCSFVGINGIVDHRWLNFPFITIIYQFAILFYLIPDHSIPVPNIFIFITFKMLAERFVHVPSKDVICRGLYSEFT
jgi:hypothetical protein